MAVRSGGRRRSCCCRSRSARHAGSLLALTGTPVNVIVSDAAADAGVGQLRVLRVRAGRRAAGRRDDRDRRAARRAAAAARGRRGRSPPRLQRPRADAGRSSTGSTQPEALMTRRSGVAEVVIPPRSASPASGSSRAWSPTAATSSCSAVQRKGEELAGRDGARGGRHAAARRAPGARWTSISTTRTCSWSTRRRSVRRQAVPLGPRRAARARRARRRWSSLLATGAVPAGRRGAARRGGDRAARACSRSSRPTAASRGRR